LWELEVEDEVKLKLWWRLECRDILDGSFFKKALAVYPLL
jgi:hypothetical protein